MCKGLEEGLGKLAWQWRDYIDDQVQDRHWDHYEQEGHMGQKTLVPSQEFPIEEMSQEPENNNFNNLSPLNGQKTYTKDVMKISNN